MGPYHFIDPRSPGLVSPREGGDFARLFLALGPGQWDAVAKAWAAGNVGALGREVHKLKGSLAIVGARKALEHSALLEAACAIGTPFGMIASFRSLADEFAGVVAELERFAADHPPALGSAA